MNLKTDIVLFTFKQGHTNSLNKEITSAGNEVTSISFRTDASAEKFPYMTTGSGDGRVYIWHLGCPGQAEEPRRLMLTLDEAHGKLFFL
jgi:WD40 repeat protein